MLGVHSLTPAEPGLEAETGWGLGNLVNFCFGKCEFLLVEGSGLMEVETCSRVSKEQLTCLGSSRASFPHMPPPLSVGFSPNCNRSCLVVRGEVSHSGFGV